VTVTEHTRASLAEIAGTFLFCTIGAGAVVTAGISAVPGTGLLAIALANGLALAIAVSVFGAISGGHFNPAVTRRSRDREEASLVFGAPEERDPITLP